MKNKDELLKESFLGLNLVTNVFAENKKIIINNLIDADELSEDIRRELTNVSISLNKIHQFLAPICCNFNTENTTQTNDSEAEFKEVYWRMQTANLLNEILNSNEKMAIFSLPIHILGVLLGKVADRASQLEDKELNKLMLRLGLYNQANPDSEDFMGEKNLENYLNS